MKGPEAFRGDRSALKWARRDLPVLDRAIAHVARRGVALQAGGNLGVYPAHLAERFEWVVTVEPSPALFPDLVANAPQRNIVRLQAALGWRRGGVSVSQTRRDGKPDNHAGITHVKGAGMIPTIRVDDLALDRLDFLQLDLEGWELFALQGATATIARCRPVILVEINKSIGFVGLEGDDVRRLLWSFGYRFEWREHSDELYTFREAGHDDPKS